MSSGGRPNKFTAETPQLAVSRLVELREKEIKQVKLQASDIIEQLNGIVEQQPKDETFWKIAIGEELYTTYFGLFKDTQRELLGYFELSEDNIHHELEMIQSYEDTIAYLLKKDIVIKILIGMKNEEMLNEVLSNQPQLAQMFTSGLIRISDPLTDPFTVIDNRKVILKVKNPVNGYEDLASIYIRKENLARELKSKFIEIWQNAEPITIGIITGE